MYQLTTDRSKMLAIGVSPSDIANLRELETTPSHFHPRGGSWWVAEHLGITTTGVQVGVYGHVFLYHVEKGEFPKHDEAMEAWKTSSSSN